MSTIKSSAENLTLNADGAGNDIKFQSNGVEKASIDQDGTVTATNFTGTGGNLTVKSDGATPAIILRDSDNNIDGMFKALNGTVGMQVAGGEWALLATTNAEISLYHDNAVKLATTATGIAITGGVAIGGTGAANTLEDYEEGTWTPTFYSNHIGSHTLNYAIYTKIGRLVKVEAYVYNFGSISGSGVSFGITGLPFSPNQQSMGSTTVTQTNVEATCSNITARQYIGTVFIEQTIDNNTSYWTSYDKFGGSSHVQISLSYTTAS